MSSHVQSVSNLTISYPMPCAFQIYTSLYSLYLYTFEISKQKARLFTKYIPTQFLEKITNLREEATHFSAADLRNGYFRSDGFCSGEVEGSPACYGEPGRPSPGLVRQNLPTRHQRREDTTLGPRRSAVPYRRRCSHGGSLYLPLLLPLQPRVCEDDESPREELQDAEK